MTVEGISAVVMMMQEALPPPTRLIDPLDMRDAAGEAADEGDDDERWSS